MFGVTRCWQAATIGRLERMQSSLLNESENDGNVVRECESEEECVCVCMCVCVCVCVRESERERVRERE